MTEEEALTHTQLQELAKREGINNPIMSTKVVGNRVELHLLGGAVHLANLGPSPLADTGQHATQVISHAPLTPDQLLQSLTVPQLKQLASLLNINYPSKVKKGELVELMLPYPLAELKEAASKIQIL